MFHLLAAVQGPYIVLDFCNCGWGGKVEWSTVETATKTWSMAEPPRRRCADCKSCKSWLPKGKIQQNSTFWCQHWKAEKKDCRSKLPHENKRETAARRCLLVNGVSSSIAWDTVVKTLVIGKEPTILCSAVLTWQSQHSMIFVSYRTRLYTSVCQAVKQFPNAASERCQQRAQSPSSQHLSTSVMTSNFATSKAFADYPADPSKQSPQKSLLVYWALSFRLLDRGKFGHCCEVWHHIMKSRWWSWDFGQETSSQVQPIFHHMPWIASWRSSTAQ